MGYFHKNEFSILLLLKTTIQYTKYLDITNGMYDSARVLHVNDNQIHFIWCNLLDCQLIPPFIHAIYTKVALNVLYVNTSDQNHGIFILLLTNLYGRFYQIPLNTICEIK